MQITLDEQDKTILKDLKKAFEALQVQVRRAEANGFRVEFDTADELYVRSITCSKQLQEKDIRHMTSETAS